MKIKYKKEPLIVYLTAGFFWFMFFYVILFEKEELRSLDYGWIVMSLIYLGIFFYRKKYSYVTIKNDSIRVNGPLGKELKLTDIKRIKKFVGDYILKTDQKEIIINTQIIDSSSLKELDTELEKLDVVWG